MNRRNLEVLASPYIEKANELSLDQEGMEEVRRASMGAIDKTTSPVRSCGGACIDCKILSERLQREVSVCNELPSEVETYKKPNREAYTRTTADSQGAFY